MVSSLSLVLFLPFNMAVERTQALKFRIIYFSSFFFLSYFYFQLFFVFPVSPPVLPIYPFRSSLRYVVAQFSTCLLLFPLRVRLVRITCQFLVPTGSCLAYTHHVTSFLHLCINFYKCTICMVTIVVEF